MHRKSAQTLINISLIFKLNNSAVMPVYGLLVNIPPAILFTTHTCESMTCTDRYECICDAYIDRVND